MGYSGMGHLKDVNKQFHDIMVKKWLSLAVSGKPFWQQLFPLQVDSNGTRGPDSVALTNVPFDDVRTMELLTELMIFRPDRMEERLRENADSRSPFSLAFSSNRFLTATLLLANGAEGPKGDVLLTAVPRNSDEWLYYEFLWFLNYQRRRGVRNRGVQVVEQMRDEHGDEFERLVPKMLAAARCVLPKSCVHFFP